MDDRFDRRELLLHLGDMLDALGSLCRAGTPDMPVGQLATQVDLFREFGFLRTLAPRMTVVDFSARVASAFSLWPKELLDIELNRKALASTVQHELFDGNPDGWNAYVGHLRKKVAWFGDGLAGQAEDARDERLHDAAEAITSVAVAVAAAPSDERNAPQARRGWPWPDAKTTR
ncbi:hypothetical protein [Paraburkholderia dilworthii]|uniref:hypothetical protein n=1 Tax=Paraburkholderia dilworthii TaxID=948106 RepID=UPI00047F3FF0|nr:hypothetical protein [Paraburkholderia dilworthii]